MNNEFSNDFLLWIVKISALLLITVFTILFAIVPLVQRQFKLNPWIVNCSQSLYCGMFLGLTFLNFIPKANDIFQTQFDIKAQEIFPLPFIICLCSYTLMLIINKILTFSRDFKGKKKHVIKDFFRSSITYDEELVPQKFQVGQWDVKKYTRGPLIESLESQHERPLEIQNASTFKRNNQPPTNKRTFNSFRMSQDMDNEDEFDDQAEYFEYKQKKNRPSAPTRTFGGPKKHMKSEMIDSHFSSNDSDVTSQKYRYQSYQKANLILLVFCFQSFIEGLILGLQTSFGSILFITMATSIHKFTESSMLCVTLILHKINYNKLVFILCVYSFIEPLGIVVGWFIEKDGLLAGFIISFVSGNLLYITSSEGIIELFEMGDQSKPIKIFQFIILLIGVMLEVLVWFAESEIKL